MSRAYKHLVLVMLVSMLVGLSMTASHPKSSLAQTAADPRPNIIFILTDDMRYDDFNARYMPQTYSTLVKDPVTGQAQGMSFQNAFVSNPLCCPSRATIMRGQYAHNTGVWFNTSTFDPDPNIRDGGWEGYKGNGYEGDNVATHLEAAGYKTGFFGKYLNQYSGSDKPPGWNEWFAFLDPVRYYDYDVNHNGVETLHFGGSNSDYSTDVLRGQTLQFIDASVGEGKPFFAYVAPKAPHQPATPAPRDRHAFDGVKDPRLPSFDEKDVSDKPPWIQSLRRLTSDDKANIRQRHEDRIESLQAVDDLVAAVVGKLRDKGVLSNTYILFTSDNGWYHGEHRIRQGKTRPYEEAPHVPLLIRGPGVQAGSSTDKLVLNTDYFPTFMDLAEASMPSYVDGRSLLPVIKDPNTTSWGRTAILIEGRKYTADPEITFDRNYNGIRTSTSKYVEYEGPATELYNLNTDRYELTNIYYSADPTVPPRPGLKARLDALKSCQPVDDPETPEPEIPCQAAEDSP